MFNWKSASIRVALTGFVVTLLVVATMAWCSERRERLEARNDQKMAEARTESASEAIAEIGKLDDRGQATQQEVRDAQEAVRNADPADADREYRYQLCKLHDRPDCERLFGTR
jgi:Flp pilus assembly protein TadB